MKQGHRSPLVNVHISAFRFRTTPPAQVVQWFYVLLAKPASPQFENICKVFSHSILQDEFIGPGHIDQLAQEQKMMRTFCVDIFLACGFGALLCANVVRGSRSHTTHLTPLISIDPSRITHLSPPSHTTHLIHLTQHLTYTLISLICHHSSLTTHLSPLISHHSSLTTHPSPLIPHHSSLTTIHHSFPSPHAIHLTPPISHIAHLTPFISHYASDTPHITLDI